ncbi:MAG TPA: histidine phosphatase family protein, partial [Sinorhizobium sp.]|nr:histidine phosphatase family protein [Sinorhizobium sp.]
MFLIRHGEPEAAWGGPDDDPGLSERGRSQAISAADRLAHLRNLSITSSPMRRCRETAAPLASAIGRPPGIDARISEVATPPGIIDRRLWLQQNFPWRGGAARAWTSLATALQAWRSRVLEFVLNAKADSAIFTHFIAINVIAGAATERPETIVCRPDYASITELELVDGALRLVRA